MPERSDDALRLRATLAMIAPGTALRDGLERILRGRTGALIVLGQDKMVESLATGGFTLDVPFTATGLRELAKMDGAIIVDRDVTRISRAAVHLMPDQSIPSEETGTRHRTAERVAKQTGHPVISVSQSMQIIAAYVGDIRHVLEDSGKILSRANQALATLERYKLRLDEVSATLSALEIEDLVTVRDVAVVAQRLEMVTRIAREIDDYVLELGTDGRLLSLQLEELITGVDAERELVVRDYLPAGKRRKVEASVDPRRPLHALPHRARRPGRGRRRARPRHRRAPRRRGRPARLPPAGQGAAPARLRWSTASSSTSAASSSCSPPASTTSRPSRASASSAPAACARASPGSRSRASPSATSEPRSRRARRVTAVGVARSSKPRAGSDPLRGGDARASTRCQPARRQASRREVSPFAPRLVRAPREVGGRQPAELPVAVLAGLWARVLLLVLALLGLRRHRLGDHLAGRAHQLELDLGRLARQGSRLHVVEAGQRPLGAARSTPRRSACAFQVTTTGASTACRTTTSWGTIAAGHSRLDQMESLPEVMLTGQGVRATPSRCRPR